MDSKVVVYLYIETLINSNFSEVVMPFVLSSTARNHATERHVAFKNLGGIKVVDYFLDSKTHVRMSFWQTKEGYYKWLEETPNSLHARDMYQKNYGISGELIGPLEAQEYV